MNRVSDDDRSTLFSFLARGAKRRMRTANHTGLVAKKEEIATLTATIETRQGDLAVEKESLKNDVADTQRSLAADQELASKFAESRSSQSSEWEERQKNSPGEGAPCESHTSRKTHALFTSVNLGMWLVLASATSSDRFSCDSHGVLYTLAHVVVLCSSCSMACHKSGADRCGVGRGCQCHRS